MSAVQEGRRRRAPIRGAARRAPTAPRWPLRTVALAVLAAVVVQLAVTAAVRVVADVTGLALQHESRVPPAAVAYVGRTLEAVAGAAGAAWVLGRRSGQGLGAVGLTSRLPRRGWVLAAACVLVILVERGTAAVDLWRGALPATAVPEHAQLRGLPTLVGPSLVATLVWFGPVVALVEEILFRGVVHAVLRQRLGAVLGVLLSAAVFALAHDGPARPAAFVAGIALAALYERSRSLWPGIAVHACNNVVVGLLLAGAARAA